MDVHACLRDEFGLDVVVLEPVAGGTDEAAQVWRARTADGRTYAVKSGARRRLDLDVAGVPRPLPGRSLHVTPWIDGEPGPPGLQHWRALGRLLAQVHRQRVDVPRLAYDHRQQVALVREVQARRTPELPWDQELVDALVERADALAELLRDRPRDDVLCHTDPHLGNVLLQGAQVWLVDWDDARLAPREHDLVFPLGGVVDEVTEQERAAFFDGYGPVELDPDRLAYARCLRALEDLEWGRRALVGDELALRVLRWQFSPQGLVRRALS